MKNVIPSIDKREVFESFADLLNRSGCTEISFSEQGETKSNRGFYFPSVTADLLMQMSLAQYSVHILGGLIKERLHPDSPCPPDHPDLSRLADPILQNDLIRRGSAEMIQFRFSLPLDIDFKDTDPTFIDKLPAERIAYAKQMYKKYSKKLKALGLKPWIVVFSGGGIHFHFKVSTAIDCSNPGAYSKGYSKLIGWLQKEVFGEEYRLDPQCGNVARTIRLPYSTNFKNKSQPIYTDVLHFDPESDSSDIIFKYFEEGKLAWEEEQERIKTRVLARKEFTPSEDHKENLRMALPISKVLEEAGYEKWQTLTVRSDGQTLCSSPLREDKNPSFSYNDNKNVFNDFGSGDKGDQFDLLALIKGLNIKTQFPEVLREAEKITGIKRPEPEIPEIDGEEECVSVDETESPSSRYRDFEIKDNTIVWHTNKNKKPVQITLCNFVANIVAQDIYDDGLNKKTFFRIKGTLSDGRSLPEISVPANEYASLEWVAQWGAKVIIHSGNGIKDKIRHAIQGFSGDMPTFVVYQHTGWREIDGEQKYLHAGGAIGVTGNDSTVMVKLGNSRLNDYHLPDPVSGDELIEAVKASLRLKDLDNKGIGTSLLGAVYMAPLSDLIMADFGIFICGESGSDKSNVTALAQAHFGPKFNYRHFPANWTSTDNALERQLYALKNASCFVDDFNPTGSMHDIAQYHKKADRVFRGIGNKSGRDRLDSSTAFRNQYYPRAVVGATGEDIPKGHSLRARLWVNEITRGEVDRKVLTDLQRLAAKGEFAKAMSSYLKWLAPRLETLSRTLPKEHEELRNELSKVGNHSRNPDTLAQLILTMKVFFQFANESGAITNEEGERYLKGFITDFNQTIEGQSETQSGADPVDRTSDLIASLLISGRYHLGAIEADRAPEQANLYGWVPKGKIITENGSSDGDMQWQPQGQRIGWVDGESLYLDPGMGFAAICEMARIENDIIPRTKNIFWKRMKERGHLVVNEKDKCTIKRTVEGQSRRVIMIPRSLVFKA